MANLSSDNHTMPPRHWSVDTELSEGLETLDVID